jgi:hypothetical protein
MRFAALFVASCVLFGQSGTPGVTEPIKDPLQIPGRSKPGPMPRSTPQANAGAAATSAEDDQSRTRKSTSKKKAKKGGKSKVSQSQQ